LITLFWQGCSEKNKYQVWRVIRQPKDQGGPGIYDFEVKNTTLLSKCIYKLHTKDGVWQTLIKNIQANFF
jgi:hypothetical protein